MRWPIEILLPILCTLPAAPRERMCSCVLPKDARSYVDLMSQQADVVLAGRVTEIRWKVAPIDSAHPDSRTWFVLAVFAPSTSWKGAVADTVIVWTPEESGPCGYPFEEGQRYLVFATRRDSVSLRSGLCTGTQSLADARKYLRVLGRGHEIDHSRAGDRRP